MLIAGVLCWSAAVVCGAHGLRSRSVAPTRLAAAVMLAAGGAVAPAVPRPVAVVLVGVCIVGALGTIAAGSWQSARDALRREAAGCDRVCAACTLPCR